jgi:hypothetical protein
MAKIMFADKKLSDDYCKLKGSQEHKELFKFLERAITDIENNHRCGIPIAKNMIPREYVKKYDIDNLWKYNLPGAWRLMYSVGGDKIEVIAIILEWCDHKSYEKQFGYL